MCRPVRKTRSMASAGIPAFAEIANQNGGGLRLFMCVKIGGGYGLHNMMDFIKAEALERRLVAPLRERRVRTKASKFYRPSNQAGVVKTQTSGRAKSPARRTRPGCLQTDNAFHRPGCAGRLDLRHTFYSLSLQGRREWERVRSDVTKKCRAHAISSLIAIGLHPMAYQDA